MRMLVVTLAPTLFEKGGYYSYAPYVKEMDIWFGHVEEVTLLSPTEYSKKLLTASFLRKDLNVKSIPEISFTSFWDTCSSIYKTPYIFFKLLREMQRADHIHLRCPGTIPLLGCIAQVFFPKKTKTAKYAGNWDPKAKQPLSYRIQKKILSNTFFTRNMKALVYGDWPNQSKNIKPFFTASYPKSKVGTLKAKKFEAPFSFLFVGGLTPGKRPLYAIQLVEALHKKNLKVTLDMYGEGVERTAMEAYVEQQELKSIVTIHGNQASEVVEKAYQQSDFLILPSQSEGWPKVVAEAMFWGAIPISTAVSCVPWMLNFGKRGLLLSKNLTEDSLLLTSLLENPTLMREMSKEGQQWSHKYTLDDFEAEIKKLLV